MTTQNHVQYTPNHTSTDMLTKDIMHKICLATFLIKLPVLFFFLFFLIMLEQFTYINYHEQD